MSGKITTTELLDSIAEKLAAASVSLYERDTGESVPAESAIGIRDLLRSALQERADRVALPESQASLSAAEAKRLRKGERLAKQQGVR